MMAGDVPLRLSLALKRLRDPSYADIRRI